MGGTWFTADLHFGHKLVSGLRGFADTEAHDASIVDRWRQQVRPDDVVWVLGDVTCNNSQVPRAMALLAELPGTKHLVAGNHDPVHPMHSGAQRWFSAYLSAFATVQSVARIRAAGLKVLLSHFPYETDHTDEVRFEQWRVPNLGASLLHGHTHSTVRRTSMTEIHVGWDAWGGLVPLGIVDQMLVAAAFAEA